MPRPFPILIFFSLVLVSKLSAGEPVRNVILFVTDDQSQTLGCYGDAVADSPNIDMLAKNGVVFDLAFATTASCSASRSVILSGLHNHKNGQYGHQHHFHKFGAFPNVASLALPRVMAKSGYRTARAGKYHVAPEVVFHFEKTVAGKGRDVVAMAEGCREFLSDQTDQRPFFLYFATQDPHRSGQVDANSKLELKPNLFGNKREGKKFGKEKSFDPANVPVPSWLNDDTETREELAHYYQSCSRVDEGLGRLIDILKENGQLDSTMIIFTADHGAAFSGAKTSVYEPGLRVPFVVHNPYAKKRGFRSKAMISHVDITPTILDFAKGLNRESNSPKKWENANKLWDREKLFVGENRSGSNPFRTYQGKSFVDALDDPEATHRDAIFGSHTFHEIQMYYPMRTFRDRKYKLIFNIAHKLDYPFASDLFAASSWQRSFRAGMDARYGQKSVGQFIQRPRFELYDMAADPYESRNLAADPAYAQTLADYQELLKQTQKDLGDPWITKWRYE